MNYALPKLSTAYDSQRVSHILLAIGAVILAYDPIVWLARTWRDPSYDSHGFVIFFVCLSIFIWSVSSKKTTCKLVDKKYPFFLIGLSALVRFIGQVLAINIIGALTLVIDVYAISRLSSLHLRTRAVAPLWFAVCFSFSLPLERIVQRTIGFVLQHLSADGACSILGTFFENVTCHGVRILIDTKDVLVDLPCSGARSVLLLLFLFFVCAAVTRSSIRQAVIGLIITLLSAYVMNVIRITVLAIGLAYPVIDVMAQPVHDLIGLIILAFGCVPVIIWAQRCYTPPKQRNQILDKATWLVPRSVQNDGWWLEGNKPAKPYALYTAIGFIALALTITNLPRHAIDVAYKDLPIDLPTSLGNEYAHHIDLLPKEKAYFTQYGGSAQKASYGPHTLMIVRTSAPLRHLHAPDECLRGLGMDVEYKGVTYEPLPSAIYKATNSEGASFRIAVTFMPADQSLTTTNISEAIWRWLHAPHQSWMAVQRISSWDEEQSNIMNFDRAVMAALDINQINPIEISKLDK